MEKNTIFIYGLGKIDDAKLDNLISYNIARGDQSVIMNIRRLHMDEVQAIREYMMTFLAGTDVSNPRILSYYCSKAVSEMGIDIAGMYNIGVPAQKKDNVQRMAI